MPRYCIECGIPLDSFETRWCGHCTAKGLELPDDTHVCPICGYAWSKEEDNG